MRRTFMAAGLCLVAVAPAQTPPPPSSVPPVRSFFIFFQAGSTDQASIDHAAPDTDIVVEAVHAARIQDVGRICVSGFRDGSESANLSKARADRIIAMLALDRFPAKTIDASDRGDEIPAFIVGVAPLPERYRRLVAVSFESPGEGC